ncbi:MAG: hypothetical protein ABSF25_08905 [Bryobacteraceae bacterium]|jgi:hypothetical protein
MRGSLPGQPRRRRDEAQATPRRLPAPLCGDYRVFLDPKDETTIEITGIRNRREAYR